MKAEAATSKYGYRPPWEIHRGHEPEAGRRRAVPRTSWEEYRPILIEVNPLFEDVSQRILGPLRGTLEAVFKVSNEV